MPRISEEKIEEVRGATNIVHYINQFLNLKKAGQNFKGLCPFHTEKTPSFIVSPEKQIYHCFGCGKGGNVFSFIMDFEKLSFIEAVSKAADFSGILLPKPSADDQEKSDYYQQLHQVNEKACQMFEEQLFNSANKAYLDYFLNRGLSAELIKKYRLGYAPDSFSSLLNYLKHHSVDTNLALKLGVILKKDTGQDPYDKFRHRIIFPFQNTAGKIVGFGGRKLKEEQQPKYLNSPESPIYKKGELLYGLHQAISEIRNEGYAILVEGYFDLLRLVESGFRNVVASSGTALTSMQARLMKRYTRDVYIAYDGDDAGVKAAMRVAVIIENADLNALIVKMPSDEDPDSIVQKNGAKAFKELLEKRIPYLDFQLDNFFSDPESSRSEKREQFIHDLLYQLSDQKNQIKTGLFLHQIADRMQINESLLIEQFNRLIKNKRYTSESGDDKQVETKLPRIKKGVYQAEKAIIALLIGKNHEVKRFIMDYISTDMFENQEFSELYKTLMIDLEETGNTDINRILTDKVEDKETNELLAELAVENIVENLKYARDCVYQVKKWHLEKKAKEISSFIKAESDSIDSVMHYVNELSAIRKEIAELNSQLKIQPENPV